MVLFEWGYAYITFRRGARLTTGGKTATPELDASSDIGKHPTADEPALSAST